MLRDHGVPMTGNKDQLVSELAKLAARLYHRHQRSPLPARFAIHHLRGNVILNETHEIDTFVIQSLALSLVKQEVQLSESFRSVRFSFHWDRQSFLPQDLTAGAALLRAKAKALTSRFAPSRTAQ